MELAVGAPRRVVVEVVCLAPLAAQQQGGFRLGFRFGFSSSGVGCRVLRDRVRFGIEGLVFRR